MYEVNWSYHIIMYSNS